MDCFPGSIVTRTPEYLKARRIKMGAEQGKKVLILNVLKILQKYTDADHTMTQQQIVDKMREDYHVVVDRATVKRNLHELIESGYPIQYNEIVRTHKNKKTGETEENSIYTALYYEHDFTEAELHMLIDGLLFSRSVPYKQRRELIDKLGKLSNIHFNQRMNHVHCMSADSPQNPELFHTIDILDEAIAEGKQICLTYGYYGTDLKLHKSRREDGSEKRQIINPYQLVANEGRYYLICNNDHHSSVANYRIDRIMNVELLDTPVKPMNQVEGLDGGVNLQKYVYQNLYMFSGKAENVEFIIPKSAVSLVIDFFGKHVSFAEREDGTVSCRLLVSKEAMKRWAVQFGSLVRVVSPPELVEEIREEIRKTVANYDME